MAKKVVSVVLVLAVLLVFAAPAFPRWGPRTKGFGPVVLGHPWGDYHSPQNEIIDTPMSYRLGSGAGFQGFIANATTSFAVQFYVKYVAKKTGGPVSVRYGRESD